MFKVVISSASVSSAVAILPPPFLGHHHWAGVSSPANGTVAIGTATSIGHVG